jgi:hypothetical protein
LNAGLFPGQLGSFFPDEQLAVCPQVKRRIEKDFLRLLGLALQVGAFLYACSTKRLKRAKLFEEVIGENEVVEPAEADQSLIVQGILLEYRKAGVGERILRGVLESFTCHYEDWAGNIRTPDWCRQPDRFLRARVAILRRTSKEILFDQEINAGASGSSDTSSRSPDVIAEERLAIELASQVAGAAKKLRP